MKQRLVGVLEYIVSAVVLFLVFFYGCTFSVRQSIGLCLCVVELGRQSRKASTDKRFPFVPYQIRCTPNAYLMFSDIGLVKTQEEFQTLVGSKGPRVPWDNNNVIDYGMYTVFLFDNGENGARGRSLVHFPWEGRYSNTLDWEYRLTSIRENEGILPEHLSFLNQWSPRIFMRHAIGGYEIGVCVDADWWKQKTDRKMTVMKEDSDYNTRTTRLTLCFLPFAAVGRFYSDFDYVRERKQYEAYESKIENELRERGWQSERLESEVDYLGEEYAHRYMRVWVNAVN